MKSTAENTESEFDPRETPAYTELAEDYELDVEEIEQGVLYERAA